MGQVDISNLIIFALGLAVTAAIPSLFPRMSVPGVVLEVVFGVAVGPQVLDWVHMGSGWHYRPARNSDAVT